MSLITHGLQKSTGTDWRGEKLTLPTSLPFDLAVGMPVNLNDMMKKARNTGISPARIHKDLYSCILEELPVTTLNDKVNIFFFLGTLVEQSERARFRQYGDMVRRDLGKIVGDVAPLDGGAANIAPARKASHPSDRAHYRY